MQVRFVDRIIGFELRLRSETRLEGVMKLGDADVAYIHRWEEHNEDWYLSPDGDRLSDHELLEASPWSLLTDGGEQKLVKRYLDEVMGTCWFSLGAPEKLNDWL